MISELRVESIRRTLSVAQVTLFDLLYVSNIDDEALDNKLSQYSANIESDKENLWKSLKGYPKALTQVAPI